MANWNLPLITSGYLDFVAEMNSKFEDSGTMFNGSNFSNIPNGSIRWNRSTNVFQEWLTSINGWQDKVLGVAGGGTGSASAAGSRVNLGLGSMAIQNSNAVAITGGTITGISFDIGSVTTGVLPLARGGTGQSMALTPYGTVMVSDGARLVLWTGDVITALNASALTTGTVPPARLTGVGLLDSPNTWNGSNAFNGLVDVRSSTLYITGSYPGFYLVNNVGALNQKRLYFFNYYGDMYIQSQNDDGSFAANIARFGNDGRVYMYGGDVTSLNGANITTGVINPYRLGYGTPSAGVFLRGDGTWAEAGGGSGGTGAFVPSGMIAIFTTACPAGWTRFTGLDGRFPLGSSGAGSVGGNDTHTHSISGSTDAAGNHDHSFSGTFHGDGDAKGAIGGSTGSGSSGSGSDAGGSFQAAMENHFHNFAVNADLDVNVTVNVSGNTSAGGQHNHGLNASVGAADHTPKYYTVVYCRKD